jgi:hypothetical protein
VGQAQPVPQLKVRHISSRATLPSRCSQSNTAGSGQLEVSISRPKSFGTTRMIFSTSAPPVTWAIAWRSCLASSSSTGLT